MLSISVLSVSVLSAAWFLVHLLIGAAGAGFARRYALRRALLDQPGERRSHSIPTPRGGGVAIAVSLLVATTALAAWMPAQAPMLAGFGVGLALVSIIGWVDDHRPLSARSRLAVHLLAGAVFAIATWWQVGDARVAAVAFLATVALVNVWNFMDGIDGLAASQAILVAAIPAGLAGGAGLALGLALVGATLGFLPWNFPRAKLFLGDVGSGAIGFALGALVALAVAAQGVVALSLSLLPLSAFLVDAGMTLARRMLRRERWWEPHVTHAYQHAARGHGHVRVTAAFAVWTSLAIGGAFTLSHVAGISLIIPLVSWYVIGAAAWMALQRHGAAQVAENRE